MIGSKLKVYVIWCECFVVLKIEKAHRLCSLRDNETRHETEAQELLMCDGEGRHCSTKDQLHFHSYGQSLKYSLFNHAMQSVDLLLGCYPHRSGMVSTMMWAVIDLRLPSSVWGLQSSGVSQSSFCNLTNYTVRWATSEHPKSANGPRKYVTTAPRPVFLPQQLFISCMLSLIHVSFFSFPMTNLLTSMVTSLATGSRFECCVDDGSLNHSAISSDLLNHLSGKV